MSDKLNKIFHRDFFQVGDVVAILGNADDKFKDNIKIIDVKYQPFSLLYQDRARKLCECLDEDHVVLKVPNVDLSDVLYRLTKKIGIMHFTINMINSNIMEFGDIMKHNPKTGKGKWIRWILANKDGKTLGLWEQSESTQTAIGEILE